MSQDWIHINQALQEIKRGDPCLLKVVRSASNSRAGTVKTYLTLVHGIAYHRFARRRSDVIRVAKSIKSKKHVYRGSFPAIDLTNDQQVDIYIHHIIQYNDKLVKH